LINHAATLALSRNIFSHNNNISQNATLFVTLRSGFCFYTESTFFVRQEALLTQLKSLPHPVVVIRNQVLAFTLLHVLGSCSHLPEVRPLATTQPVVKLTAVVKPTPSIKPTTTVQRTTPSQHI
jgi:hypothetical protein